MARGTRQPKEIQQRVKKADLRVQRLIERAEKEMGKVPVFKAETNTALLMDVAQSLHDLIALEEMGTYEFMFKFPAKSKIAAQSCTCSYKRLAKSRNDGGRK